MYEGRFLDLEIRNVIKEFCLLWVYFHTWLWRFNAISLPSSGRIGCHVTQPITWQQPEKDWRNLVPSVTVESWMPLMDFDDFPLESFLGIRLRCGAPCPDSICGQWWWCALWRQRVGACCHKRQPGLNRYRGYEFSSVVTWSVLPEDGAEMASKRRCRVRKCPE